MDSTSMLLLAVFTVSILFVSTLAETSKFGCSLRIANLTAKKAELDRLLDEEIKMVYFDLSEPAFVNRTGYSPQEDNGIFRWIWVQNDVSYLLRFPEDINAISFNLLEGVIFKHLNLQIDYIPEGCNLSYSNYSMSVKRLLLDDFTIQKSDWKLCHRTFANQQWKVVLENWITYWLGYDFECFYSTCGSYKTNCKTTLDKSVVNYVVILFLFVVVLYFPLLFYFFPESVSKKNLENRIKNYTSLDIPYSLSRLFLNLNATVSSFKSAQWLDLGRHEVAFCHENQFLAMMSLSCYIVLYVHFTFYQRFVTDADKYGSVYLHSFFIFTGFNENISKIIWFVFYFITFSLCVTIMTFQIQLGSRVKNVYFIPYIFHPSIPPLQEVDVNKTLNDIHTIISVPKYKDLTRDALDDDTKHYCRTKYEVFVIEVLNRISILFTSHFYLSLFDPLCSLFEIEGGFLKKVCKSLLLIILVFLNAIFVFIIFLFPFAHFFLFPPMYYLVAANSKWYIKVCILPIYLCVMTIIVWLFIKALFIQTLSYLLQSVIFNVFIIIPLHGISFKFWLVIITVLAYLRMFYTAFYEPYKILLKKCFCLAKQTGQTSINMIPVKTYREIADVIYPLHSQIALLAFKLLCLCITTVVLIETVIKGVGGDGFIEEYLPALLFIFSPVVAMQFNQSDPTDYIEKYEDKIVQVLEKNSKTNEEINPETTSVFDKFGKRTKRTIDVLLSFFAVISMILLGLVFLLRCCFKTCKCKLRREEIKDVEVIDIQGNLHKAKSKYDVNTVKSTPADANNSESIPSFGYTSKSQPADAYTSDSEPADTADVPISFTDGAQSNQIFILGFSCHLSREHI